MGPSDPHPNWHLGMRGAQHRAVMWRVWKEGGTGFLYWGANCYEKAASASAEVCLYSVCAISLWERMELLVLVILYCYFPETNIFLWTQIRFRHGLPPGDGVLYYPGEVFSNSHQPVASLRLERLLSGLQV